MAKIMNEDNGIELPDGSSLKQAAEELGVEFGCKNGFCRTCEVTILQGYENLTDLTENEEFIELQKPRRLMCQCRIKHGTVKIKLD